MMEPPTLLPAPSILTVLEEQVLARLNGRVRDFRLVMNQDGLVLRGQTQTYYAKQLAQHAVMDIANLPICANEIEVT